ncbi:hypothetical protein OEZ85_004906 [Tetradesmus obliquus]|uniref:Protein kinase domain-containing protein n=1 Tax=Tetradesmus obliquus TaxID=3088 RepID=A0ABY8ULP2_TETOB|nr:hypothetical protein OEZ85_004906 [Tetradesmus obliquus]
MPQGEVLTTKGSPFAIMGCSDALALYKYESGKYTPSANGADSCCPISRVFADLQPELPSSSATTSTGTKQQVEFGRVAEAQRAGIHSTLLLTMYDTAGSSSSHCAVFELAQHEVDQDFTHAVNILNSVCQDAGFCVPQLESVCQDPLSPNSRSGLGLGFGEGLGQSPGSSSGFRPAARRLPRPRQSFIVTDYFRFEGADSSRIARTASGFVPAAPPCTPGKPGSFGRVYRGTFEGQDVAIKQIIHRRNNAEQIASEVSMMMRFQHPHLVRAYHYVTWSSAAAADQGGMPEEAYPGYEDAYGGSSGESNVTETWIISEFMNAGTLQDAVLERNTGVFFVQGVPQMGIMLPVLLGVAQGMCCLHEQGILHGDLKAANVMLHAIQARSAAAEAAEAAAAAALPACKLAHSMSLPLNSRSLWAAAGRVLGRSGSTRSSSSSSSRGTGAAAAAVAAEPAVTLVPKITDFGMSRVINEGFTHLSTTAMGTVSHQAPELMRSGRLSKQADVFSFGVIMWETIMAAQPWKGRLMAEILNDVMNRGARLRFSAAVPQPYKDLAEACCLEEPQQRPTFGQIVQQLQGLLQQAEDLQQQAGALFGELVLK